MKNLIVAFLVASQLSCGSVFIEPPPEPPPFEDCTLAEKHFKTGIKKSFIPLPFTGREEIRLFTDKPEFWDLFEGSIHLKTIKWNVDWIRSALIIFDEYVVARWSHKEWFISSTLDLSPYFKDKSGDPSRLQFDITLSAKGTKPSRYTVVEVDAEFYFCGENADLMFDLD